MNANEITRAIFRVAMKREKKEENSGIKYLLYMQKRWKKNNLIVEGINDLFRGYLFWVKMQLSLKLTKEIMDLEMINQKKHNEFLEKEKYEKGELKLNSQEIGDYFESI